MLITLLNKNKLPNLSTFDRSQIILTLLSTGEVYLVDLRAQTRGRLEITEPHDDDSEEEESEQQVNKAR